MGIVPDGALLADIVFIMGHDTGKRCQSTPQGFTQYQYIRRNEMLTGEHLPGATESFDDFIKDQQAPVLFT